MIADKNFTTALSKDVNVGTSHQTAEFGQTRTLSDQVA